MIGFDAMRPVGVNNTTTNKLAGWMNDMDASDAHLAEPNVSNVGYGLVPRPPMFDQPRKPVAGFRAITMALARIGIPRLPMFPPSISRMGQGYSMAGGTPKPINKVQQFVPVPSVATTGDWYSYLA